MANTANLGMEFLEQNQSQKHVTVNDALIELDAVVQLSVINRTTSTPPANPANGDRYLIGASPTGAWTGSAGKITMYQDNAWHIYTPKKGWICYVEAEKLYLRYDTSWAISSARSDSPNGAFTALRTVEELLTGLTGATKVSTVAFPNQCIILGVSTRVITAITGATSFDCGDGVTANRFGGNLGVSAGSTNQGLIGPAGNYAPTTVTLTANGGNFTGGSVRIALHYIETSAPAA
jgi:hypothetical protein